MNAAALKLAATLAAALLLVTGVYLLTKDRIEEQQRRAEMRSLAQVMPPELYDNDPVADQILVVAPQLLGHDEPRKVYRGWLDGQPSAVALQVTAPDGYHGNIDLIVGIRANGTLSGVRVTQHRETPGLGDGIDVRNTDWITTFTGKSLYYPQPDRWQVKRDGGDFDQFTGATITPRAVVRAVHGALDYFNLHQQELFAPAGQN